MKNHCQPSSVNRQPKRSLPNTKLPEDPGELFFVDCFTGDLAWIVEGADVQIEQVTGKVFVKGGADRAGKPGEKKII